MAKMKEKTRMVFDYCREHAGEDITAADVAEALGIEKRSVDGSFTSFQKKGWGLREEAEILGDDDKHIKVKYLRMTEAGLNADPDQD